jgi:predicted kinase
MTIHSAERAKLIFLCGKMAAGKSTLARDIAERKNAILLVQDEFLDSLFPGEITDIPGFIDRSRRLRNALTPHVCALLSTCERHIFPSRSEGNGHSHLTV